MLVRGLAYYAIVLPKTQNFLRGLSTNTLTRLIEIVVCLPKIMSLSQVIEIVKNPVIIIFLRSFFNLPFFIIIIITTLRFNFIGYGISWTQSLSSHLHTQIAPLLLQ